MILGQTVKENMCLIEEDRERREQCVKIFSGFHLALTAFPSYGAFYENAQQHPFRWDLLLVSLKSRGMKTLQPSVVLPSTPWIALIPRNAMPLGAEALNAGAVDFFEHELFYEHLPVYIEKLKRLLSRLETQHHLQARAELLSKKFSQARQKEFGAVDFIGKHASVKALLKKLQTVARVPRPVLIYGERGTGKELAARLLHLYSPQKDGPFVCVNCASIPEPLLEAELFGYEKGAFTDARESRRGQFEAADGGTLFLDEIASMPEAFQSKILRVIEYGEFQKLGGKALMTDARIAAATNKELEPLAASGKFRADLYDRLSFETLAIPPLRDRMEDIPLLCGHFIKKFRAEVPWVKAAGISKDAVARLQSYPFPGNVRELKNILERALYQCESETLGEQDISLPVSYPAPGGQKTLGETVSESQKNRLLETAVKHKYNMKKTAKELGLTYAQARYLFKKHNIR